MPKGLENISNSKIIFNYAIKGFSLKCPSCSKSNIFKSYLKVKLKDECSSCGLNLQKFDIGDGPAYIAIFLIGILIPVLAIIIDVAYRPSLFVHIALWVPLTFIFSYLTLIFSKSVLLSTEYKIRELEKGKS